MLRVVAEPLPGLPELEPGVDLAALIAERASASGLSVGNADVLVIAQKAVSKVEGRLVRLAEVTPTKRAKELASKLGKDARLVQLALGESAEVLRADRGVLITRTRQGHICANAGIDSSNVPGEAVSLLPSDPDRSARELRASLRRVLGEAPAVVISDTFGRPWRVGQTEVAIGCAGLRALDDRRGQADALGRPLTATAMAIADEAASAAGLVREKDGREAVVLVRGLERYVTEEDGPGAGSLLRPVSEDLFR